MSTPKPTNPSQSDEYLDDAGAALLLGVRPKTVRAWRMTRGLPFIRASAKIVRIYRPDLHAWAAARQERRTRVESVAVK